MRSNLLVYLFCESDVCATAAAGVLSQDLHLGTTCFEIEQLAANTSREIEWQGYYFAIADDRLSSARAFVSGHNQSTIIALSIMGDTDGGDVAVWLQSGSPVVC